jgi:hypothetical protein
MVIACSSISWSDRIGFVIAIIRVIVNWFLYWHFKNFNYILKYNFNCILFVEGITFVLIKEKQDLILLHQKYFLVIEEIATFIYLIISQSLETTILLDQLLTIFTIDNQKNGERRKE